ncbi:MAG: hypothetical protein LUH51_06475 [Firmicutes bacterium]|nr:hypothetical protein [Bacillota bacterium]
MSKELDKRIDQLEGQKKPAPTRFDRFKRSKSRFERTIPRRFAAARCSSLPALC